MLYVVLVGLLVFFYLSSTTAVNHTLQYFCTATSGISNIPEFVSMGKLDGVVISYHDSNMKKGVPRHAWMKQYWDSEMGLAEYLKADIANIIGHLNQTGGVHVYQRRFGCQLDNETGTIDSYDRYGFDGEDFLSLDMKEMRWISHVSEAVPTKRKRNRNGVELQGLINFLTLKCVERLKKYVQVGRSTLQRKVHPKVSVFRKDSSPSVVCHATGFYPKEVMITWKRDGEEILENVDVGETLPDEDGTFQKRAVLTVSPEERKKGTYTCEVQHVSGEPINMTLTEEEGNTLSSIYLTLCWGIIPALLLLLVVTIACVLIYKVVQKGYKKAEQSDTDSASTIVTAVGDSTGRV